MKEGIRFFINIYIHKKAFDLKHICNLITLGMDSEDNDTLKLSLFGLMLISENEENHKQIFEENNYKLLENLSKKTCDQVNEHSVFYTTLLMNFSLNANNIPILLNFKFLAVMNELCNLVNENCHCYIHTYLNQVVRLDIY